MKIYHPAIDKAQATITGEKLEPTVASLALTKIPPFFVYISIGLSVIIIFGIVGIVGYAADARWLWDHIAPLGCITGFIYVEVRTRIVFPWKKK